VGLDVLVLGQAWRALAGLGFVSRPLTSAGLAATMNHLSAIHLAYMSGREHAIILEEGVDVADGLHCGGDIQRVIDSLPPGECRPELLKDQEERTKLMSLPLGRVVRQRAGRSCS
jgi:hypothetical protein